MIGALLSQIHGLITLAAGIYMVLFTLGNILYLKRVSRPPQSQKTGERNGTESPVPKVSVLIPARNEENRIAPAIHALTNQDYPDYEVIVLDDNSEDRTAEVVQQTAAGDRRIRCISGRSLPEGWKGKPFAMEQLSDAADGEILIFIDADMCPEPTMISWTVAHLLGHEVDFLSGYARHTTPVATEFFLFPVMYLATSFLLPLWAFRFSKSYMFSHAIGQYFCIRASVLRTHGGFRPVKDKINEDIQMARYLKGRGCRQVFLDAKDQISGNMYDSMDHARMGIMRVLYEYFDKLVYPFIFMGFVLITFLLLPVPLVFLSAVGLITPVPSLIAGTALVFLAWLLTMLDRRLPFYVAFFYPIHFGWALLLAIRSIRLSRKGEGYSWKGRIVR